MKTSPLLPLLLLAALARAEAPEKLLEQLREEVRMELRSSLDKENEANNERLVRLEGILIEEIPERDVTSGKLSHTLGGLLKLRTFTHSKKAEAIVSELVVPVRKAMVQEQEKFVESYRPILRQALLDGLKTDQEDEVDTAVATVQALKRKLGEFTDVEGNQLELVDSDEADTVVTALRGWQNGLIGLASHPQDFWTAIDALNQIEAGYEEEYSEFVPHSEFARLLRSGRERWKLAAFHREHEARILTETRKILRAVKDLDGLAGALESLRALDVRPEAETPGEPTDTQRVVLLLQDFMDSHRLLQSGAISVLPPRPQVSRKPSQPFDTSAANPSQPRIEDAEEKDAGQVPPALAAEIDAIFDLLLRDALPKCLAIAEAPFAGESMGTYLRRHAARALKEKNWTLLERALDTSEELPRANIFSPRDALALRSILAAVNQQRARRYSAAVASYLVALRSGSQSIPAEWIGDELAGIRKEHAEDFEAGQHLAPEPLPPVVPPGYPPIPIAPHDSGGEERLSAPGVAPVPGR